MTIFSNFWQPPSLYDQPRRLVGWDLGRVLLLDRELQPGFVGGSSIFHYTEETYSQDFQSAQLIDFYGSLTARPIYSRLPGYTQNYNKTEDLLDRITVLDLIDMLTRTDVQIGTTAVFIDRSQAYLLQSSNPLPPQYEFFDELIDITTPQIGITYLDTDLSGAFTWNGTQFIPAPYPSEQQLRANWISVAVPDQPVADWLTFPWDCDLILTKLRTTYFYEDYLDPSTAFTQNLDWLAQYFGWSGEIWRTDWDDKTKRALLNNSLGWFDTEIEQTTGVGTVPTVKGEALLGFPFDNGYWSDFSVPGETPLPWTNFREKAIWNNTTMLMEKSSDITAITPKEDWNGLHALKGTEISAHFMFDISELRGVSDFSFTPTGSTGYELKSEYGFLAQGDFALVEDLPLRLWYIPALQIGEESDAAIGNFTNQLIMGCGVISDEHVQRTMFIRLPFAYERGGPEWGDALHIAEFFMPLLIDVKVSYAVSAIGYMAIGDPYFNVGD